ncbi:unnamed protein product [Rhizophagus irregularis]|nr:unnamed protein product [Rhizophagus irregularis]
MGLMSVISPLLQTLKDRISTVYETGKILLKINFHKYKHVSLTLDAWSSSAHYPYLGVTAHWLTSKIEPREILLSMAELPYPHGAIGNTRTLNDYLMNGKLIQK